MQEAIASGKNQPGFKKEKVEAAMKKNKVKVDIPQNQDENEDKKLQELLNKVEVTLSNTIEREKEAKVQQEEKMKIAKAKEEEMKALKAKDDVVQATKVLQVKEFKAKKANDVEVMRKKRMAEAVNAAYPINDLPPGAIQV